MFFGRQVVYPSWLSDGMVSSVWQSAAEVYTPFDYLGNPETASRTVSRRAIERMLDRARSQVSAGSLGKAMTLAKGAAHLAYENGYEDLLNEARRFVTHELESAYLDGLPGEGAPAISVIHDRKYNEVIAWSWFGGLSASEGWLKDLKEKIDEGRIHIYYLGADPDSAARAIQWLSDHFGAELVIDDERTKELLYSAMT